jgi:membrane fusion protein (multidrug efflux system)
MTIINKILAATFALMILAACGGEKKKGDTASEIARLKAEQKNIQSQLATLEKSNTKADSVRKVSVMITTMSPTVFNNYVDVQGKVDLDEVVNAVPEMPGIINSIRVRQGQYVRKGQVVATVRSETTDKGIDEIDQQISFAKLLYDKQKRLWDQEIGREIDMLTAKNNYESLLKRKTTTLSGRGSYNVYAPISGVVDAVDATVGQSYASPVNPPVIRIINTGKLKVKAEIAENYASQIRTGSNAMLVFPDVRDTLVTKVQYAEKMINTVSRSFAIYIPLPANPRYQPNMIVQVKVATYQNGRAFVLPTGVIQKTDKGDFVYVADEQNKARLVPVRLGNIYQSKVEILDGLQLGDKVVTTGFEELNEGDGLQF